MRLKAFSALFFFYLVRLASENMRKNNLYFLVKPSLSLLATTSANTIVPTTVPTTVPTNVPTIIPTTVPTNLPTTVPTTVSTSTAKGKLFKQWPIFSFFCIGD